MEPTIGMNELNATLSYTSLANAASEADVNTIDRSVIIKIFYVIAGCIGLPGNIMTITVILSSVQLRSKPGEN